MADTGTLIDVVPTIRFGRERTTHGYRLAIEGQDVVMFTRCGIRASGEEYQVTHGVVSCSACGASA